MANYYFLTSIFPRLELGHTPGMHFEELVFLLHERLKPKDFKAFCTLRRFVDMENLRSFLKGESLDSRGNLTSEEDFENALSFHSSFPDYVYEFLLHYDSLESRLKNFSSLLARFFKEEISSSENFLKRYLIFEREWRLVMLGFRAKRLDRDLLRELQYEDPSDLVVAQIIAQKDSKGFEPPYGYEDLKVLFENKSGDPLAFHKSLCDYRFKRIEELESGELFSIDKILSYMAKLTIVEKWLEMDQASGNLIIENLIKEAG